MLTDLADLYIKIVESFGVVFSLVGQVFKYRPWMIPLIPITMLVMYVGVRIRRGESADARRAAQRRYGR